MIEELAVVKQLEGDKAIIEVVRKNTCSSCQLNNSCGMGSLGRLLGHRPQILSIQNDKNLKMGDTVVIGLPEKSYLSAGFLIYLLPLMTLFLFAGFTDLLFDSIEWLTALASMTGLASGLLIAARISNRSYASALQPRFIRQQFLIK